MASLHGERPRQGVREDALRAEIDLLRGTVAALRTAHRPRPIVRSPELRVVPLAWVVWATVAIVAAVIVSAAYVAARCW
jgi:hypothetical protein